ncbi:hypothetical protein G3576_30240 [Roseomonas stagni]|uniref:Lipoprotein n=1 Tax=Falsiroseomonas algicola TaxID=2716930 RepID=A0A6M1LV09_9PROT|nr:hypothetical protein [Falsiroseomonas algicola]NGM24308.1 hypothetical protein [Falsiroseomonas algicola]
MMRAGSRTRLILLATGVLSSGCASGDPRSDGFFGGIHGLQTGSYATRQQQQEVSLAATRQAVAAERGRQLDLLTAQEERARQIAALNREIAGLRTETQRLRANLSQLSVTRADLAARRTALEGELARTERELDAVSRLAVADGVTEDLRRREALLKADIERLKRSIDAIGGMR